MTVQFKTTHSFIVSTVFAAAIGIGLTAGTAQAGVISQVQTKDIFDAEWDDWDPNLGIPWRFDQFDDQGGLYILQSVKLTVHVTEYLASKWTNDTASPSTLEVVTAHNTHAFGGPSGLGVLSAPDYSHLLGEYTVGANDELTIVFLDYDIVLTDEISTGLSAYIGASTVDILSSKDGNQWDGEFASVGGPGSPEHISELSGSITLTYNYTVIPGPAGLALLGIGGLMLRGRRRAA